MSTQRKSNQITSGLAVTTFGGLQIEIEGKPLTGLSRKPQALLVYLACESRFHPREVIADMLWDDFTQDRALHNLRVVLSSLRKHARAYLTIDREKAGIKKGVSIWVDAGELENMALQIQALGGIRSIGLAREVEQITTVYRGEFLEGFFIRGSRGFEDWLIRERERYHQMTLELHGHLADHFAQGQDFSSAIRHATRMLALDPLYEAGHRQLIGLLAYSGQRNAAIRQYEFFHKKLKEEIGVEPHPDTKALYQAIQAGTLESPYQRPSAEIQKPRAEPPFLRPGAVPRTERPLFVGRSPQIDQLATRVQAARDGTGQIAFIIGEAGAGKTSLLQAFAFKCEQFSPECLVIFGNCGSIAQTGDPFLPFRQALGMLLGEVENVWQEARLSSNAAHRLWATIPQAVETLLEYGPDLLEVFFQGTDILETLASVEKSRDRNIGADSLCSRSKPNQFSRTPPAHAD